MTNAMRKFVILDDLGTKVDDAQRHCAQVVHERPALVHTACLSIQYCIALDISSRERRIYFYLSRADHLVSPKNL